VRKIRTAVHLSSFDRNLALLTLVLMTAVRVALWTLPFRWMRTALERSARVRFPEGRVNEKQVGWAVRLASRYVPRATCLTQAVTAQALLKRARIGGRLVIGVSKTQRLEGHTWVEVNGYTVVGGTEDVSRFPPCLHWIGISSEKDESIDLCGNYL